MNTRPCYSMETGYIILITVRTWEYTNFTFEQVTDFKIIPPEHKLHVMLYNINII